jgi:hypothetical protein
VPNGGFEAGTSVQKFTVALPRESSDCAWSLTDRRTGRFPAGPFPRQSWQLEFAGHVGRDLFGFAVRVRNRDDRDRTLKPRRWLLRLRCAVGAGEGPACFAHSFQTPEHPNYFAVAYHCNRSSRSFKVKLPLEYRVDGILGADNARLHEGFRCSASGRWIACRGATPAWTTTSLGLFLSRPVRPLMPTRLRVPGAPDAHARAKPLGNAR